MAWKLSGLYLEGPLVKSRIVISTVSCHVFCMPPTTLVVLSALTPSLPFCSYPQHRSCRFPICRYWPKLLARCFVCCFLWPFSFFPLCSLFILTGRSRRPPTLRLPLLEASYIKESFFLHSCLVLSNRDLLGLSLNLPIKKSVFRLL